MITRSDFRPAWWLPGPHLQTLYPTLCRRRAHPQLGRERLELADGDFIDLDWTDSNGGPVVLVLHGLEGSLASHYSGGILGALTASGYHAALMYFRGCSGEPNRLPRSYHSGETADLQAVIDHIRRRHPATPLAVIGYSLGGNVLLKWLGEQGQAAALTTAVAISVPFELDSAARRLEQGLSRIYQRYLLRKLRRAVRLKATVHPPPVSLEELSRLATFHQFDDAVTAPLHGFKGVGDYYRRSSSRQYLDRIVVPTLILQAQDDPFLPARAIPVDADLSKAVTLELSPRGGHVGFIAGRIPFAADYWLETRICRHLQERLTAPPPAPARQPGNTPQGNV
jgi:predicted alpha/beta-fold hydrolase